MCAVPKEPRPDSKYRSDLSISRRIGQKVPRRVEESLHGFMCFRPSIDSVLHQQFCFLPSCVLFAVLKTVSSAPQGEAGKIFIRKTRQVFFNPLLLGLCAISVAKLLCDNQEAIWKLLFRASYEQSPSSNIRQQAWHETKSIVCYK